MKTHENDLSHSWLCSKGVGHHQSWKRLKGRQRRGKLWNGEQESLRVCPDGRRWQYVGQLTRSEAFYVSV